jgi:nicotinate-nucleotide pyrophosphorylase (carboxylating)
MNELHDIVLEPMVRAALAEDFGDAGDITSQAVIAADAQTRARLISRKEGVLCGAALARLAFQLVEPKAQITFAKKDGDALKAFDLIGTIAAPTRSLLGAERVALNYLTHLSGIATLTRAFVKEVAGTKAKITCTRKTLPGLRALQKYAVRTGGGSNHRFGLYDAILIKDNHIAAAGSVIEACRRARHSAGHLVKVEVEVDTLAQIEEALAGKADVVMLDNFSLEDMKKAVGLIQGRAVIEASGGVTLVTVKAIAATGVDYISAGSLTHSAPALDIGLDF